MAKPILLPSFSPTMTAGTLANWLVNPGDSIKVGDLIAEIETDKSIMELEADQEGVIGKLLVEAGSEVPVGEPLAIVVAEGEKIDLDQPEAKLIDQITETSDDGEAKAPTPQIRQSALIQQLMNQLSVDPSDIQGTGDRGQITLSDILGASTDKIQTDTSGVRVSPLAKRIAKQSGTDLSQLTGSGGRGRIVKADLNRAPIPTQDMRAYPEFEVQAPTVVRKTIAERMTLAKRDIPHYYISIDCRLDKLIELRKGLNEQRAESDQLPLSINDFLIRAAALSLAKVPEANVAWSDEGIIHYSNADICVAVALESGLIAPILPNAQTKGVTQISRELRDLVQKAREGRLQPKEYQGGTFTLSNLGMYRMRQIFPILNPPQACILGVGMAEKRPIVVDDEIAIGTMMTCTLSVDHRVADGTMGATYIDTFRELVENPVRLLVGDHI